jgi:peptidylprolyl isomerase
MGARKLRGRASKAAWGACYGYLMSKKTLRIQRLLLVSLALGVLLTLVACGGGESATVEETATPAPAAAKVAATSEPGGGERVAQDGDSVLVHYHGTLDDRSVFDSSRERDPLRFVVGAGGVIAGFDNAVRGLAVGDAVIVRMEPAEAYGERDESMILEFPRSDAPEGLSVGDQVSVSGRPTTVLEITDEIVRIDANHALAGQALTFEIELVAIE